MLKPKSGVYLGLSSVRPTLNVRDLALTTAVSAAFSAGEQIKELEQGSGSNKDQQDATVAATTSVATAVQL